MNHFSSDPDADSSIFWNESSSRDRQRILTPRVLLFDLEGNWPRSPGITAAELERTEAEWDGGAVHRVFDGGRRTPEVKAPGSVPGSWSDYLEWKLEGMEKVSFPISNFTYNSSHGVLSNYEQGTQIYASFQERVVDGIRYYAENCDYLEVSLG